MNKLCVWSVENYFFHVCSFLKIIYHFFFLNLRQDNQPANNLNLMRIELDILKDNNNKKNIWS